MRSLAYTRLLVQCASRLCSRSSTFYKVPPNFLISPLFLNHHLFADDDTQLVFMSPPRQTGRRRHYVINMSVRLSVTKLVITMF